MTLTTEQLRARAVAWEMRYWNSGHNCWHDWERITAEQHAEMSAEHATDNDYEFRVLYDAPTAPAPANAVGYFLRYRVEWHTPSKWSAWAEIDEVTYDNALKIIATGEADAGRFYEARILYDAPPAPAVPDELLDAMEEVIRISDRDHEAWDKAKAAITACRAAMLVAAPDGWIACSERMPEPNKYVQVSNGAWVGIGMYNDADHFDDDERWQDEHQEFIDLLHHPVTHWMPLPTAPTKGEKQ
ncbi:DUF551 domain-containing protein [Serratia nevei]|uniref:DUF551 domain-containing protein n=1 Tax=Serratia nevei TaxID=2703794 RepID=UPI003FA6D5E4